ncbi:hypothetical protein R1flu_020220 [Riccia fluitans]|uniref:Uncharacterized protein n=1 Tax=Riccia fluitans TaxID=41844 RepID=A0ABD1ZLC6_9MARC
MGTRFDLQLANGSAPAGTLIVTIAIQTINGGGCRCSPYETLTCAPDRLVYGACHATYEQRWAMSHSGYDRMAGQQKNLQEWHSAHSSFIQSH